MAIPVADQKDGKKTEGENRLTEGLTGGEGEIGLTRSKGAGCDNQPQDEDDVVEGEILLEVSGKVPTADGNEKPDPEDQRYRC